MCPTEAAASSPSTPPNRTALSQNGAQFALFVAELDGKRVKRYNTLVERSHRPGTLNMYG